MYVGQGLNLRSLQNTCALEVFPVQIKKGHFDLALTLLGYMQRSILIYNKITITTLYNIDFN